MRVAAGDAHQNRDEQCEGRKPDETVLYLISLPSPVLELQGKHRNLGNKNPRREEYAHNHHGQEPCVLLQLRAEANQQRAPEERIGRRRETYEARCLASVKVELCQSDGAESRNDECEVRDKRAYRASPISAIERIFYHLQLIEYHARRRDAECDIVGKRV